MKIALACTLVYWFIVAFDETFGTACSRPIFLGFATGLVCGDVKTGVIMGASLEAIFMGISPIGGVMSSNTRLSTVIGVSMAIMSGMDIETALAIAVPIGSLLVAVTPLQNAIKAFMQPVYTKLAEKKKYKTNHIVQFGYTWVLAQLLSMLVIFFCVLVGNDAVAAIVEKFPTSVNNGLSAAASMLVVVGLCLTTQTLWSKKCGFYVLLGFVLAMYMGLGTLPIAIVGVIIAALTLFRNLEINEIKLQAKSAGTGSEEGDDFFG